MKLPELKNKFNNRYVIRIVAGVLTIAMVGTGVSVYSAHTESPEQTVENVQLAAKDETDLNLADMLKDNISVSDKEIGKDETVYLISDATGNVTKTIVSDHLINKDNATTLKDKSTLKDIENVKGDEEFTQSGDDVTWQADGSDIYYQGTSTEKTPVSMKVSYKLDGKDVKPEELAGKSGKVTIRYDYTNNSKFTETVNGEEVSVCVPFAAITGMVLDDSFTNVEVTNGKVQTSGNNNIVMGYALPGLKDSLNLKDSDLSGDVNVPEYFEVTADVENFSLETAMTVVANAGNFLSTDGSSDLSSVDDMINTLTDASSQLQNGSAELASGLDTLQGSLKEFSDGMNTLANGLNTYTGGVAQLNDGAAAINAGVKKLDNTLKAPMSEEDKANSDAVVDYKFANGKTDEAQSQALQLLESNTELQTVLAAGVKTQVVSGTIAVLKATPYPANPAVTVYVAFTMDPSLDTDEKVANKYFESQHSSLDAVVASKVADTNKELAASVADAAKLAAKETAKETQQLTKETIAKTIEDQGLVSGAAALADGTSKLVANNDTLTSGAAKLVNGTSQVVDGVNKLDTGSHTLADGMVQFNESGINKLVNAYTGDLKPLASRLQAVLDAGEDYQSYTDVADGVNGSVKFVYKLDAIKAADAE